MDLICFFQARLPQVPGKGMALLPSPLPGNKHTFFRLPEEVGASQL
jgi:hypothetical protein